MASTNSILENTCKFLDQYIPKWFEKRKLNDDPSPLFVFVSGPQGSGKSYTATFIHKYLLEKYGATRRIANMSIDDFYLTHEDQVEFSKRFSDNKLLQGRGLPGTHDIPLLSKCIDAILSCKKSTLTLPVYDKSKYNGEGDRSEKGNDVKLPLDIIILEGWFLGFAPILERHEINSHPMLQGGTDMIQVNANLFFYSDLLWKNPEINSLGIVFAADDIQNVYEWRLQQEQALKKLTGESMTDEQVRKFIDRYFPSYQLYYKKLVDAEDLGSIATLTLGIDLQRNVFSIKNKYIE